METEAEPLMPEAVPRSHSAPTESTTVPWIPLAAASGACAAFNGVFAKLYAINYPLPYYCRGRGFFGQISVRRLIKVIIAARRPN